LECWPILFDNFDNRSDLPRLIIVQNRFAVVIIIIAGNGWLHPIVSFSSLPFSNSVINLHVTFSIFCLGLEIQIFIVFGQIQLPIAFFFFNEIISIVFSLLICQFLFGISGRFDFPLPFLLVPINHV